MATKKAASSTAKKAAKRPTDHQSKKKPTKKVAATQTKMRPEGPSAAADFKQRLAGEVLPLPSGLAVRARRVQLEDLVLQGNVPNQLMAVVNEALDKGQKADIASMVGVDEGEVDIEMVRDMFTMVNEVVVTSVVSPVINPVPDEGDEKDDDLLYVDEVDPVDKMFIFQWCIGGTDDLERFRQEAGADMASLAEIQSNLAEA